MQEGFHSNRTDFIRTAIRNQLGNQRDALKQTIAQRSMALGLQRYTDGDLERVRTAGEQVHIQVLGLATIDDDVPPTLAALIQRALGTEAAAANGATPSRPLAHSPRPDVIEGERAEITAALQGAAVSMGAGGRSIGCTPMRSYSAITWAPSSSTIAPISTLSSTAIAVVIEP